MQISTVAFIGLGVMGEPMCRNLAQKSRTRVRAFDIDPIPIRRLADDGVEAVADAVDAVRGSDVVFISLPSGTNLATLILGPAGIIGHVRAGQIIVDMGTSPVKLTRQIAAEMQARGAHYLDAPVARTREAAVAGTLSIMVGGDVATFEKVRPLLAHLATDITHCGPTGSGQATKILNNMVLFQTVAALSEAYVIARRSGFDPERMFNTLAKGSGDSFALRNHGLKSIVPQQFPLRAFSVVYARKDLSYALELAAETGVNAGGARRVDNLFQEAIASGLGDKYFPVVSTLIGATNGSETRHEPQATDVQQG